MRELPLGDAGLNVSALCLGTMFFGTRVPKPHAEALLDRYVEAGGRFLDTANNYAFWVEGGRGGESEELLGCWMRSRGNRDALILATKVGGAPGEGLSARAIERAVEGSLRRLGTDRIDLYYAHIEDRSVPLDETLEAFDRLVRAGKVRHVGASNHPAWRIERARQLSAGRGWAAYCCVQQRHSYLRVVPGTDLGAQQVAGRELLDYCAAEPGVALLAYSPLLGGSYARPERLPAAYRGPDTDARRAALRAIARETGASAGQVVLAWLLATGALPLIAASTREQLDENLAALDVALMDEQLAKLDAAGRVGP